MRNKETVDVRKLSNCRNQKFAAAEEIPPVALYRGKPFSARFISVRLRPGHLPAAIDRLKTTWRSVAPDLPFQFRFLDDEMDRLYQTEERSAKVVACASILAVAIACIGLFVLAGALSFCIALLTVGYQAIRAARANPVEALRYE